MVGVHWERRKRFNPRTPTLPHCGELPAVTAPRTRFSLTLVILILQHPRDTRGAWPPVTPVTFYLLPRPLTAPPEPPSGPPPPESAPSPCTLRGCHPSPRLLTGSFSEPPLWSSLCRTNDIHLLALVPELWDLQVQPHPRSDGLTPVPEAGSPRSPSADRAPPGPGARPGRGDAPARSCPCRTAACGVSSAPR